jgi:hypothetical protein
MVAAILMIFYSAASCELNLNARGLNFFFEAVGKIILSSGLEVRSQQTKRKKGKKNLSGCS